MAQAELQPAPKIPGEHVDPYVKAICAMTGVKPENVPPVGEVTNPQMNLLLKRLMNFAWKKYQQEQPVADLE